MLRAAKTDSLSPEVKREGGVIGIIGVDPYANHPRASESRRPIRGWSPGRRSARAHKRDGAEHHDALATVQGDESPSWRTTSVPATRTSLPWHRYGRPRRRTRRACPCRGRSRRHGRLTAMAGQDALGGNHALEVVGVVSQRTRTTGGPLCGRRRRHRRRTRSRPRRRQGCVQAASEHLVRGLGIELRMEELVELARDRRALRPLRGDEALLLHLDSDVQRGGGGSLADAGLQHLKFALLNGELDVAHVTEVVLKDDKDASSDPASAASSRPSIRCFRSGMGLVLRMPATTSSPWALTR